METRSFLFQDTNIQYTVYGEGSPVILLHGFGEDGSVWKPQVDFLKNNFRVIVPDIPGSGRSPMLSEAGIDTYADVIKMLCDIECGTAHGGITLVGHSMGGYITLAFAEKYPAIVKAFGLFHSSAFADTEEKKETRRKAIDFIKEKGADTFLRTSTPNLFTQQFREAHPEQVEALIEQSKNFTEESLIQYYNAMIARPDRTAVLKSFEKPVLFIIGEHDQAIPFDSSMKQCHLPAVAQVVILRESAHMGMWEETTKANAAIASFLTSI